MRSKPPAGGPDGEGSMSAVPELTGSLCFIYNVIHYVLEKKDLSCSERIYIGHR